MDKDFRYMALTDLKSFLDTSSAGTAGSTSSPSAPKGASNTSAAAAFVGGSQWDLFKRVLALLQDTNSQVQSLALRCLVPLSLRVAQDAHAGVLNTASSSGHSSMYGRSSASSYTKLSGNAGVEAVAQLLADELGTWTRDSDEARSAIAVMALKSLAADLAPTNESTQAPKQSDIARILGNALAKRTLEQLLPNLLDPSIREDVVANSLDIAFDLFQCFGGARVFADKSANESNAISASLKAWHEALLQWLSPNRRSALRRKAAAVLSGLLSDPSVLGSADALSAALTHVLSNCQSAVGLGPDPLMKPLTAAIVKVAGGQEALRTGLQVLATLVPRNPAISDLNDLSRLSVGIVHLCCALVATSSPNLDPILEDDVIEASVLALDAAWPWLPVSERSVVATAAASALSYDPNYADDMDSDDSNNDGDASENGDDTASDAGSDDASDYGAYSDDEDVSWKTRKAAAKLLASLADTLALEPLFKRVNRERHETVKLEILASLNHLLQHSAISRTFD